MKKVLSCLLVKEGSSNEAKTYIKDTESTPAAFNSPVEPGKCSYVPKTTITVSWNEGASDAEKLERIITQKWLPISH